MIKKLVVAAVLVLGMTNTALAQDCLQPSEIYSRIKPAVVKISIFINGNLAWNGSGTVLTKEKLVVTSNHVIEKPEGEGIDTFEIVVTDQNGNTYPYEIASKTPLTLLKAPGFEEMGDLGTAIIKPVNKAPADYLPYNPGVPNIGDVVYSLGYPMDLGLYFSSGNVTQVVHDGHNLLRDTDRFFLSSLDSGPGASGAAVFNCHLEQVGVVWGGYYERPYHTLMNFFGREVSEHLRKVENAK